MMFMTDHLIDFDFPTSQPSLYSTYGRGETQERFIGMTFAWSLYDEVLAGGRLPNPEPLPGYAASSPGLLATLAAGPPPSSG